MAKLFQLCLLLSVIVSGSFSSLAQDVLYLRDNTTINAKVKEIASDTLRYTLANEEYVLNKSEVVLIKYEDGTHEIIKNEKPSLLFEINEDYGKHLVSWQPGELWRFYLSFSYEYFFKQGLMSLRVPLSVDVDPNARINTSRHAHRRYFLTGVDYNIYPFRQRIVSPYLGLGTRVARLKSFKDFEYIDNAEYERWIQSTNVGLYARVGVLSQLAPNFGVSVGMDIGVNSVWYDGGKTVFVLASNSQFSLGYRF